MNTNQVNQKIQKKIFAELDSMERETTDKKVLESINNIRKIFNES